MHGVRGPVWCPTKDIGTDRQIIKIKKYANGTNNSGPVGYKATQAYQMRREMAKRARAARDLQRRKGKGKPSR